MLLSAWVKKNVEIFLCLLLFLLLVSSNKHNVKMELKAIVFFPLFFWHSMHWLLIVEKSKLVKVSSTLFAEKKALQHIVDEIADSFGVARHVPKAIVPIAVWRSGLAYSITKRSHDPSCLWQCHDFFNGNLGSRSRTWYYLEYFCWNFQREHFIRYFLIERGSNK